MSKIPHCLKNGLHMEVRLSVLRTGRALLPTLTSNRGWVNSRKLQGPEGLGKKIHSSHRVSNPRPSSIVTPQPLCYRAPTYLQIQMNILMYRWSCRFSFGKVLCSNLIRDTRYHDSSSCRYSDQLPLSSESFPIQRSFTVYHSSLHSLVTDGDS
jgi:hypothetical protein